MKLVIKAKLPSLNDLIAKNRTNKYMGAKLKKDTEKLIGAYIKKAVEIGTLRPISDPCEIYIEWIEKTKRRDVDNVESSVKFILDSLVKNGILKNDNPRYVKQIHHYVRYGDENMVRVRIERKEE